MPISTLAMAMAAIVMFTSWYVVGRRIARSRLAAGRQVSFLHQFFLHMGIFCAFLVAPMLLLSFAPERFPVAMAWGYVVGHIFCYIAFTYVLRLQFSMLPRLARFDGLALAIGIAVNAALTVYSYGTMISGVQPAYNAAQGLVEYNATPLLGAGIAVFATVCVLPTAILMIVNGIRNPGSRLRSFLLGGGLFILMIAGPLHDVAPSAAFYTLAEIITIIGLLLLVSGVLYRYEEHAATARVVPAK